MIDHLVEMQREMSLTRPVEETVQAFLRLLRGVSPADHLVYVVRWPPEGPWDGAFRVLFDGEIGSTSLGSSALRAMFMAECDEFAECRGGLMDRLMREARPLILDDVGIEADDPAFGHLAGTMRGLMCVPIFIDGRPTTWAVSLAREPGTFDESHLRLAIGNANMLVRSVSQRRILDEIRTLHDRNERQLRELGRVQRSLLPAEAPRPRGWRVATSYRASLHAGGDYYDFAPSDGEWLRIVIADVSGHGAAAAAQMAVMRTILHTLSSVSLPPARLIRQVNDVVLDSVTEGMFVTAYFLALRLETGELLGASCGHPPPRIRRAATGEIAPLEGPGNFPLGIQDYDEVGVMEGRLEAGDLLVLYTDGITEALDAERRMFGVEGLDRAIALAGADPERAVDEIRASVERHAPSPQDDQTIVAILREARGG